MDSKCLRRCRVIYSRSGPIPRCVPVHPLSCVSLLIATLGHENAPVRRSCALSFSDALDTHPNLQTPLLIALKELYREKVQWLKFMPQILLILL